MPTLDVICVGAANLDTITVVDAVPGSDERAVTELIIEAGGGPAATAAVAMARQGVAVGFCGVVGDDEAGKRIVALLAEEGVDTRWVVTRRGISSPRSVVIAETSTGARTIIAGRAIAPDVAAVPVGESVWLHVDQVGFGPTRQALENGGAKLSVDAGNPIHGFRLDGVELYAPTVAALRRRYPAGDLAAAMRAAAIEGAAAVVATDGSRGSYLLTDEAAVVSVPAYPVDVVSTIGAGDVFHGALLAGIVQNRELADAVRRANAVAALSCRGLDGRSGIPTAPEVDAFLAPRESAQVLH